MAQNIKNDIYQDYLTLLGMRADNTSKIKILERIVAQGTNNWRVVGITRKALEQFADQNYKYVTRSGIQRAHIHRRHDTFGQLIDNKTNEDEFWRLIDERDITILAAKGETKDITLAKAIEFENPPELFKKENQDILFSANSVGYRHAVKEREFLRNLHAEVKSKDSKL